MRNNYTENHECNCSMDKRVEQLEKKLQRYTEVQADLYMQLSEIAEDLEEIRNDVKALKQEFQALKNHVKERNSRVSRSTR